MAKRKLAEFHLNPGNPRMIKDPRFKKLCESIKAFPKMLELRPIVYDPADGNKALGGNMRLRALQKLGYEEIDEKWVKSADELTPEEKERFILADNVEFGEWDFDLLANFDETLLDEVGFNINLGEFDPEKEWQGMPSFESDPIAEAKKILVRFMTVEDYQAFTKLIGQKLTMETKSIWYPKQDFDSNGRDLVFTNES